uniref:Transmembrane protein n=1 Tax=Globodera pallida TaxID=36090 RepID=A0A183CQ17_GLOPA
MVENATVAATTTDFPPTPTGSTPEGPLNRMGNFLAGLVGGEHQQQLQQTTTPGANASDHEALSNNDRVANASSTVSANIDAGGIATTVTPPLDNTTSNVFSSTTEMSPSIVEGPEVEVWNFAEGMDNMTTPSSTSSTTTERPPVPASAAVALNAWAVNLVASAAVVAVVFFRSF